MRDYRGKRADNGEWAYGWYMEHPFKDDPAKPLSVIVQDEIPYEVIPETVGQYTGLKDKGKKIYGGMNVKGISIGEPPDIGIVVFRYGCFCLDTGWKLCAYKFLEIIEETKCEK